MLEERFPLTELMSCNWRCLLHQTSILSVCELQNIYAGNLTWVFIWKKGVSISTAKPLHFWFILLFWSTVEFIANKGITLEYNDLRKFNIFHCSVPLTGPPEKAYASYSTCIKSFYPFGFKCNSWKAQNKRGNSGVARCRLINKITNDMNCPKMTLK